MRWIMWKIIKVNYDIEIDIYMYNIMAIVSFNSNEITFNEDELLFDMVKIMTLQRNYWISAYNGSSKLYF